MRRCHEAGATTQRHDAASVAAAAAIHGMAHPGLMEKKESTYDVTNNVELALARHELAKLHHGGERVLVQLEEVALDEAKDEKRLLRLCTHVRDELAIHVSEAEQQPSEGKVVRASGTSYLGVDERHAEALELCKLAALAHQLVGTELDHERLPLVHLLDNKPVQVGTHKWRGLPSGTEGSPARAHVGVPAL
jgi:hypothetical protein